MAYIIGAVNEEEIKEAKRRGWKLEVPPKEFQSMVPLDTCGDQVVMIYVDSNLMDIISGPDWDQ